MDWVRYTAVIVSEAPSFETAGGFRRGPRIKVSIDVKIRMEEEEILEIIAAILRIL